MKAIALVGGFGTRLRPLTLDTPKQMLPVLDRPMLEWVVGALGRHGIDEVVLSLGFLPDAFHGAYPDDTCAGVRLSYAVEPEPLDTAGAIRFAALAAGIRDRFVVVNGDVLTDLDLTALVERHDRAGAEATIALHKVDDPSRFGVVPTTADGRVVAFVEKPPPGEAPTDLINAGTYVLEPSVLDRIASGRKVSIEREVFPAMVADGTLFAFDDGGVYWLDTGTPEAYVRAQVDLASGLRGDRGVGPVAPTAVVSATATVSSSVVLDGAVLGAGAVVEGSAVLPGACVDARARIVDSVIGPDVTVGPDAVLERTVVGRGEVVAAGARLLDARVPSEEA